MANLDDLENALVMAKDCTNDKAILLKQWLSAHNVPKLRAISKQLSVKLSGVVRKADIVERLVCMAQLGCIHQNVADSEDLSGLSYITPEVKEKLYGLPSFYPWIAAVPRRCYSRFHRHESADLSCIWLGKTSDMQSMWAFQVSLLMDLLATCGCMTVLQTESSCSLRERVCAAFTVDRLTPRNFCCFGW